MSTDTGRGTARRMIRENGTGEVIILPVVNGTVQAKARAGRGPGEIELIVCEIDQDRVTGDVFAIAMGVDQALDLAVGILKQIGRSLPHNS